MNTLPDGSKWAAITFNGYTHRQVEEVSSGVTELYTLRVMEFSCACGNKFELPTQEFKGKRQVPDCGCGSGKITRKAILSVYVPVALLDRLDEWARSKTSGNRSHAVIALIEAGIN